MPARPVTPAGGAPLPSLAVPQLSARFTPPAVRPGIVPRTAVLDRLLEARAAIGLGDLPAAADYLADAQRFLDGGLRFPELQDDAHRLAAALDAQRASAAGGPWLTPAELRLLPLLATQHPLPEIAGRLSVSVHTVKAQVTSVYRKLGVSSRAQAIDRGRSLGLLPSPRPLPRLPSPRLPLSGQAPVARVENGR